MKTSLAGPDANFRLQFWVDEFKADPKLTNFQVFIHDDGTTHDELVSEDYRGLADSGLTEEDVTEMLANNQLYIDDLPDGSGGHSGMAYYYFNEPDPR
ncbi:hypothetical protein [Spirosoma foliorum]|uniref:Uncharacterized protein n=1 Tax=Spirosoma foliorum TaxID=2710596 RepID=A0A7G5H2F0_9BACT|nr:hypothetical protein [Spirosoma foliorum]QMW05292.1 hypothetical protein H3H32_10605 [Spirosoma foliorum]